MKTLTLRDLAPSLKALTTQAKPFDVSFELKADCNNRFVVNVFHEKKPLFGTAGFHSQQECFNWIVSEFDHYQATKNIMASRPQAPELTLF